IRLSQGELSRDVGPPWRHRRRRGPATKTATGRVDFDACRGAQSGEQGGMNGAGRQNIQTGFKKPIRLDANYVTASKTPTKPLEKRKDSRSQGAKEPEGG